MRIAYVGNFQPEHSTENHVARSLRDLGHDVLQMQENDPATWERLRSIRTRSLYEDSIARPMFLLWTRTWDLPRDTQLEALLALSRAGVPTVGFHLDRWWGLDREPQVHRQAFFACDLVCTADGGHDDQWRSAGVDHVWLPPAVAAFECEPAEPDPSMASDVAFVGSWQPGYHAEWTHRPALVAWLQRTYGDRVRFWPKPGEHAVRGEPLRRLYASTKVNVGDSCLVGDATRYWSDRIPETIGRGGFLLHPHVEGLDEHFTDGEHLATWPLGDWDALRDLIDHYVSDDEDRQRIAKAGREHVLAHHTYAVRVRQVIDLLTERGML